MDADFCDTTGLINLLRVWTHDCMLKCIYANAVSALSDGPEDGALSAHRHSHCPALGTYQPMFCGLSEASEAAMLFKRHELLWKHHFIFETP